MTSYAMFEKVLLFSCAFILMWQHEKITRDTFKLQLLIDIYILLDWTKQTKWQKLALKELSNVIK